MKRIKEILYYVAIAICFTLPSIMAPLEAQSSEQHQQK